MISLIIYGSSEIRQLRMTDLQRLLDKHGLKRTLKPPEATEWYVGVAILSCIHVEIDATLLGASTDLPLKKFLVEALKLPGIFDYCPEHSKRKFWDKQEQILLGAESKTPKATHVPVDQTSHGNTA